MANKRNLKKAIRNTCGSIAAECVMAIEFVPDIDVKAMDEIINKLAMLQEVSLSKASFACDKSIRDFDSRQAYNKARHEYFRSGFHAITADFNKGIEAIVKEMNANLPQEQKEINKTNAQA